MKKALVGIVVAACLGGAGLFAQGAEQADASASAEDEFFGSAEVEVKQGTAEKANVADVVEKEHVGLSGVLQATSSYTMTRDFVEGGDSGDNTLSNLVGGDFLVDIRLQKGFKAFLDLNVGFIPGGTPVVRDFTAVSAPPVPPGSSLVVMESQDTAILIKEVFIDFNVANTVYFRMGKQVLKWGTGYFWNPTDLISIEHRSFTNTDALLQGVFGLRSDVVFSPSFHLYTFLNMNEAQTLNDFAFAARSELLLGTAEVGISAWVKPDKLPVFGADLSTPIFWKMNLTSEASLSWGDNQKKMDTDGQIDSVRNRLVPKIDVGVSRSFDAFDIEDRVNVTLEFFYNSSGYDQNMLEKLSAADLGTFFSGFYQAGSYGQYYGAFTVSIGSFGLSNMTLTLSGLGNFSDMSATVLAGLSYAPVNDFTLSLQLGSDLGPNRGEYTAGYSSTTGDLVSNQLFIIVGAKVAF